MNKIFLRKFICIVLTVLCLGFTPVYAQEEEPFVPDTDGAGGFVARMYTVVLDRPAEQEGYESWLRVLLSGESDGAGVARDFLLSDEFLRRNLSNEEYVTVLYNLFFDREPDPEGFNAWVAQLRNGVPVSDILVGFVNSTEWANTCLIYGIDSGGTGTPSITVTVTPTPVIEPSGNVPAESITITPTPTAVPTDAAVPGTSADPVPSVAPNGDTPTPTPEVAAPEEMIPGVTDGMRLFVRSLYSECLSREASSAEINSWTAVLADGSNTGKQVAYGFFFSNEFIAKSANMTDDELITVFYRVFLNRAPDADGLAAWRDAIAWGDKIGTLFSGFADSSEFARKCESYGVICGDHINVVTYTATEVEQEFLDFMANNPDIQRGIDRIDAITPGARHTEFTVYNVQDVNNTTTRVMHLRDNDIAAIERFAAEHFLPGWTNGQKLAYTCWWINRNVTYSGSGSWGYAEAIFDHRRGQCAQYNGAMIEMMCLMGYDVSQIQGFRLYRSGDTFQHFWGEVNLGGTTYVIENGNYGDSGNWHYFIALYSETRNFVKNGSVMNY